MHTNEQAMGKGAVLSCDVCGAEVCTNERLLRHVEREHAYQCPVRNANTLCCFFPQGQAYGLYLDTL